MRRAALSSLRSWINRVARKMIERISDKQLRHRIYQAILRGMLIAIDMKAKELGAPIIYNNGSRIGRCIKEEEKWHRDVASTWNLLRALADGSIAPSPSGITIDGSPYHWLDDSP